MIEKLPVLLFNEEATSNADEVGSCSISTVCFILKPDAFSYLPTLRLGLRISHEIQINLHCLELNSC